MSCWQSKSAVFGLALACLGATGCRHKQAMVPVVLAQTTAPAAPIEPPPTPESPPMVQSPPVVQATAPPTVVVKKPRKAAKKPAVDKSAGAPAAPAQVASAGPAPEVSAIGALSAGGDAAPKTQQQAADVIASVQKRLDGLAQKIREQERRPIEKIRRFLVQAQAALKSGDAEGAKTLATKASLLLDDLPK